MDCQEKNVFRKFGKGDRAFAQNKSMIYINQHGRCGNQMFLYAFARILQIKRNDKKIIMDFSDLGTEKGEFWGDSLQLFNTVEYETVNKINAVKTFGTKNQQLMSAILNKLNSFVPGHPREKIQQYIDQYFFSRFSRFGLYFSRSGFPCKYKISKNENVFVSGLFESASFFYPIRKQLVGEFTPKNKMKEETQRLYEKILNNNSICISFRNWNIDVDDTIMKNRRTICDFNYYKQAIDLLRKRVKDPVFVVFSDDVEWARKMTENIIGNDGIILSESGNDDVAVKLKLMSACKHFILANSTFCWWAQFLCENESKIVVSPKNWLKIKNKSSLLMDDWILL